MRLLVARQGAVAVLAETEKRGVWKKSGFNDGDG